MRSRAPIWRVTSKGTVSSWLLPGGVWGLLTVCVVSFSPLAVER